MNVAIIGSFDGIHRGHRAMINLLKNKFPTNNILVITFDPHPKSVLIPNYRHKYLTLDYEKQTLLQKCNVEQCTIPFTIEFSKISPDDFIKKYLIEKFKICHLLIGPDFRFGYQRQGDIHTLSKYSNYFVTEIMNPIMNPNGNHKISSTMIRKYICEGTIHDANQCLGYRYSLSGEVVHGDGIGHTLGFPTANIAINTDESKFVKHKLIPADGVYIVDLCLFGKQYFGILSIGTCPTIRPEQANTLSKIEVHILDFNGDLYGKQITVHIHEMIRSQIKFKNIEELIREMKLDESITRNYFRTD